MSLLPGSLFGRMVIVLVAGLIAAQTLGLAILLNERASLELNARASRAAQRITDVVGIFDSLSPADRASLAPLISTRAFTVSVESYPPHMVQAETDSGSTAQSFAAALRQMLGESRLLATGVVESVPPITPAEPVLDDLLHPFPDHPRPALFARVQLADGSSIVFSYLPPSALGGVPPRVLIHLLSQLIIIVILTLIAVRSVTRPLSDLAGAAERIGANVNSPPLAESGPAEVRYAARAFNRMQSRILTYLRDRTRLLAAISHDLKTPITRLRLRCELLADDHIREKFVRDLQEMEAMVGRALEYAKGTDVREPSQPINVVALVESLQEDYQEAGAEVALEGSAGPLVGRPLAIKRCLGNLIDNALKYGGHARIILSDSKDALTIRIRDGGNGIPDELLERVFDPFFRIEESRNRDTGGTGLGLSIARNVAETHFGKLILKNVREGGLEATLTFPHQPHGQT